MTKTSLQTTPACAKPYPDFPLFRHRNGQWCKKVRGKLHYFGTDSNAALAKWLDEKDNLLAGRKPRSKRVGLTIRELCNRFLSAKKLRLETGELSGRTFSEYFDLADTLCDTFGKERLVEDLAGEDFEQLRKRFAGLSLVTVSKRITIARVFFKYAFSERLIDRPVHFGTGFDKPSRKNLRKAKSARSSKMIEADDLQRILTAAKQPMKAMTLLALNCGLGNTDVANLSHSAVDLKRGWINFPRPKTGVSRTCPLWPETTAAIREAIASRPTAKNAADDSLVFLTRFGKPWVRTESKADGTIVLFDAVTLEFAKLLKLTGLKKPGISFYALRHVHRTVADNAKDQPSADHIMGHSDGSIDEEYRERIDGDRLQAVVDVVRKWLWPVRQKTKARRVKS